MSKAARQLIDELIKAGVIKKSVDKSTLTSIAESQKEGSAAGRLIFGEPGGFRRTVLNPLITLGGGIGLERLFGDSPASPTATGSGNRYMESLGEEQAFRQYVDSENYKRSMLRGQGEMLHKLTGQEGEYQPPDNLLPLDADEMLRKSAALKNYKAETLAGRTRAQTAQEAAKEIGIEREKQTGETQRRAIDLLQQLYGASRQVPSAPAAADQTTQPYQY